jgi:hypothetical protein
MRRLGGYHQARVKPISKAPIRALTERIERTDAATVDELYGLEPVFEPGGEGGAALGEFVELQCPYCGEVYGSQIDLTDATRVYIEDCQVCCKPIEVTLDVHESGALLGVATAPVG